MKSWDLKRVQQPAPVEPEWEMCRACKAFKAECYVPIGDESAQMCWLCAHAVVEHDCPLHEAATNKCECMPQDVYPHRASEPLVVAKPEAPEPNLRELERDKLLSGSPAKLAAWVREAHKQMSAAQHAAVKRRLN